MKIGILHTSHADPVSEPYPHHAVHARTTREIRFAWVLSLFRPYFLNAAIA